MIPVCNPIRHECGVPLYLPDVESALASWDYSAKPLNLSDDYDDEDDNDDNDDSYDDYFPTGTTRSRAPNPNTY